MNIRTQPLTDPNTETARILAFPSILQFPSASGSSGRRARKNLLGVLRISRSPVILDLSPCPTLNHEDIDLLLQSVAQLTARDTNVLFAAGSRANRVLLEVTRIASLVPVFNSVKEALAYPRIAPAKSATENEADGGENRQAANLKDGAA